MARLEVKGPWEGPGEQKTAERLAAELPDEWVIFAGRKLPGQNRDDVDLIIVGAHRVFVLDEKAWGPRVVAEDEYWYVNGDARKNPLNRAAQVARKVAGLLRERAHGYRTVAGRPVVAGVVLSHDNLQLLAGRNHAPDELLLPLSQASSQLVQLDADGAPGLRNARASVIALLDDAPMADRGIQRLGEYEIHGRLDVAGVERAFDGTSTDGRHVLLKCYTRSSLEPFGDPSEFLARETKAINRLALINRTWTALPYFYSEAHGLFVVPLVPPEGSRNLEGSVREGDPARVEGRLADELAQKVVVDAFNALADVHAQGLTHRALHPRRVWLGRGLRVMFSDFHLARIPEAQTVAAWEPDGDIGEPYRAPECMDSVGLAVPASDVYSLSLCLAYWLTGKSTAGMDASTVRELLTPLFPWAAEMVQGLAVRPGDRPSAADMAALSTPAATVQEIDADTIEGDAFVEGALIGSRYRIDRLLGQGGFARSWLAYDNNTDQRRVLKEFRQAVPDPIREEFGTAQSLKHDRCSRVYDLATNTHPNYIVAEYIEGESLAAVADPPSQGQLVQIALDVLEALSYLHSKDLVHGDVSTGNIVVSPNGRATLIDFGLSGARGTQSAGFNPQFCAPEVIAGAARSPLADLFGLATSLILVMLGRPAGHAGPGGPRDFVADVPTDDERALWGPVGSALLQVLFAAAARDPELRPSSATAMRALVESAKSPVEVPERSERKVNPTVNALRRLYRASTAGNAGNRGLDDDFSKDTYVPTLLDELLRPRVAEGALSLVFLTGNPGDGKTSFLASLSAELKKQDAVVLHSDAAGWKIQIGDRTYIAIYDASESHGELSSDDLIRSALNPVQDDPLHTTALIAVNDGRLLQFLDDFEDDFEEWAIEIRRQVQGDAGRDARVAVVDLKRRSLAALDEGLGLADRALAAVTRLELWDACDGCRAHDVCPILANRVLLAGAGSTAIGELVLTSHLRRRRRATFRDVRSAVSWVITGDLDCEDVHAAIDELKNPLLLDGTAAFDLAFDPTSADYLVQEWVDVDPALVASPQVDVYRRSTRTDMLIRSRASRGDHASTARGLFFGDWQGENISRADVRAYRYLDEFKSMLTAEDLARARARVLLGISRLVGAFGVQARGLAIGVGMSESEWVVLHSIPEDEFELVVESSPSAYVETIPDRVLLRHSAAVLSLTLDTVELILRAADGEIINDQGSESIVQEIDGFANQLRRQPAAEARIIDTTGSVAIATRVDDKIVLETQ